MPHILAVGTAVPAHEVSQESSMALSRLLFQEAFPDIDRLLEVFANSSIHKRHFCVPFDWFQSEHSFAEKNRLYVTNACELSAESIKRCLAKCNLSGTDVDCLIVVSSTGITTPSLDARLLNQLELREEITRIPLWGLGCAGGAMGLSRAYDFAKAYPDKLILLASVELCGLTFIKSDLSKSNLIATSLFADGAAAVLVAGDEFVAAHPSFSAAPRIVATKTMTWKDSLEVMGWDVTEEGLKVIFSRDIPTLIKHRMRQNATDFLSSYQRRLADVEHFILHPGGAKVLTAYQDALEISPEQTELAEDVLHAYGNMSSPTVLFVLERALEHDWSEGAQGLLAALGPGFSSELLLLQKGGEQ